MGHSPLYRTAPSQWPHCSPVITAHQVAHYEKSPPDKYGLCLCTSTDTYDQGNGFNACCSLMGRHIFLFLPAVLFIHLKYWRVRWRILSCWFSFAVTSRKTQQLSLSECWPLVRLLSGVALCVIFSAENFNLWRTFLRSLLHRLHCTVVFFRWPLAVLH